jgi:hypothetical protein
MSRKSKSRSKSDLALLADSIAKLQEELVQGPAGEDKAEIEALLDLAQVAYRAVKAKLENATGASTRRSNRPSNLQWASDPRPEMPCGSSCYGLRVAK